MRRWKSFVECRKQWGKMPVHQQIFTLLIGDLFVSVDISVVSIQSNLAFWQTFYRCWLVNQSNAQDGILLFSRYLYCWKDYGVSYIFSWSPVYPFLGKLYGKCHNFRIVFVHFCACSSCLVISLLILLFF